MKIPFSTTHGILAEMRKHGYATKSNPPRVTKKGRAAMLKLMKELLARKISKPPEHMLLEPKSKLVWRGGRWWRETTLPFGEVPKKKKRARRG